MSETGQGIARFTCEGCGKQYRWKRELAGRRVKCAKCLTIMIAPQASPIDDHDDELYDLVPDSPPPRKHQEFEYDNGMDLGGTGVAMVPPVVKPLAPSNRNLSSSNLRTTSHRAVVESVLPNYLTAKLPDQKRSRRLRVTLIVVATLVGAAISTAVIMRLI